MSASEVEGLQTVPVSRRLIGRECHPDVKRIVSTSGYTPIGLGRDRFAVAELISKDIKNLDNSHGWACNWHFFCFYGESQGTAR